MMAVQCKGSLHNWSYVGMDTSPPVGNRCDCEMFVMGEDGNPELVAPVALDCCLACGRSLDDHPYEDCSAA